MTAGIDTPVGTPLPELVTRAINIHAREGRASEANIHDDAPAKAMGFERGFVAGGQSIGWMAQVLAEFFGQSYYETGRFEASFVSPVFQDEEIRIRGAVRDRVPEDGGVRLVCDIWLEKEDGTRAVTGTASALIV